MPTGTGKTGVVAVLTMVFPVAGCSLVLSPWDNLCDQLIRDLGGKFWDRIEWKPAIRPVVARLRPGSAANTLASATSQTVLVATFATLVQLFSKRKSDYELLSSKVGQVVIDEGHYEPAVQWGRAVKNLNRPVLLLTATPYRNDLRLFRVSRKNTFNFCHKDAEEKKILRAVRPFVDLGIPAPSYAQLPAWCDRFVSAWKKTKARRGAPTDPRAIIQCSGAPNIRRIAALLKKRGLDTVGVHHQFSKDPESWLVEKTPVPDQATFEVWVHERKLTEGLDDHRFCAVAFAHPVRNDRSLVQQLGRILRPTPAKVGQVQEKADVFHSSDLQLERSWINYREFETQPNLVATERYRSMVDSLLQQQPDLEYFGNRFRKRFDSRSPHLVDEIILPSSVVVRRVHKSFSWDEFTGCVSDGLMLQDRLLLGPEDAPIPGPGGSRLWVYARISNSALLAQHAQYEIRLGASVAIQHANLVFIANTESVYAPEYLLAHSSKLSSDELTRSLHGLVTPQETSLQNSWATDGAVARTTVSGQDLESTPTRLTDATFLCSSARLRAGADVGDGRARKYLGFGRSRISESLPTAQRERFTMPLFCTWTKVLSKHLGNTSASMPGYFRRYLLPVAPPQGVKAHSLVITGSETVEFSDINGTDFLLTESIVELRLIKPGSYEGDLTFIPARQNKGTSLTGRVKVAYDADARRFSITGEQLNAGLTAKNEDHVRPEGFITYLNNRDDAFGILLEDGITYYAAQEFYRVDYTFAEERLSEIIETVPNLSTATSEKGSTGTRKKRWDSDSMFAQLAYSGGPFWKKFGPVGFLFCDDYGTEVSDFVFIDFKRRKIAFAHAKHGKGRKVSASALQDVVGQAMKNLGAVARGGATPKHISRWDRKSFWISTKIPRWLKGSKSLPQREDLWAHIRSEILDHPQGDCEIWLVLGGTLNKGEFLRQIGDPRFRTAEAGQVVRLLSGLHAACGELQVRLRVFCD